MRHIVSDFAFEKIGHHDHLSGLLDALQARGVYTFTRDQALQALPVSTAALQRSAHRLMMRKRLLSPRQGFFVIIPLEYRLSGSPPPITFIDELMKFQGNVYYIGLLSAAALHGASHQAPVEFQVMVERQERAIEVERATMRFFVKKWVRETPTEQMKTISGFVPVSTPEATALDLVTYMDRAGHLDHVATVLSELHEKMKPKSLLAVVRLRAVELATVQRLGFLLDRVAPGFATDGLAKWLAEQRPARARLRADRPAQDAVFDEKWHLLINDIVEADEI